MNAAARQPSRWHWDTLDDTGYSCPTGRRGPLRDEGVGIRWLWAFSVAGLGVGAFGGYFSREAGSHERRSVSFQPGRLNAQTTSGDVQSGAGVAPYCKRSERCSTELPVMLGVDRAISGPYTAAPSLARHLEMHVVWESGEVYRRRCIATECTPAGALAWIRRSRQDLPGAIALWGPASSPAAHGTASRHGSRIWDVGVGARI
jgi:hypothetical protein